MGQCAQVQKRVSRASSNMVKLWNIISYGLQAYILLIGQHGVSNNILKFSRLKYTFQPLPISL